MKEKILNATVAFASITKPSGFKDGKHLLAIYVEKSFKKDFIEKADKFWNDEKSTKDDKQDHGPSEWFSKDDDGKLMFWLSAKADNDRGITMKNGTGCSFVISDFDKIGKGSVIDVSFSTYYYNYQGKPGLGRSINAVALKELVEWDGDDGLDGDSLGAVSKDKPVEEDKPKKKKKKKSKD